MKKKKKSLPTIREVTEELWKRMAPLILEMVPAEETGRPCANPRNVVDAIIFRIRTGYEWDYVPRVYGDAFTIHRTFQAFTEPEGNGIRACSHSVPSANRLIVLSLAGLWSRDFEAILDRNSPFMHTRFPAVELNCIALYSRNDYLYRFSYCHAEISMLSSCASR